MITLATRQDIPAIVEVLIEFMRERLMQNTHKNPIVLIYNAWCSM